MLVDVLRLSILTFLNGRIIPYISMKAFVNAHKSQLQRYQNILFSTIECSQDFDISALFAIATETEMLKPGEISELRYISSEPGDIILSVFEIWNKILLMPVNNDTGLNEQSYSKYKKYFSEKAEQFEQLNQQGQYVKEITSIDEVQMDVEKVDLTLDEYKKSCSMLLSPHRFVEIATSLKVNQNNPNDEVRFAKSYLILMKTIRPAVRTLLDRKIKQRGDTMETFIASQKTLSNQQCFTREQKDGTLVLTLDLTALNTIARDSNLLKSEIDSRKLIWKVTSMRNNLVHMPNATLNEDEYKDYYSEYIMAATEFGVVNKEYGKYITEVQNIDRRMMNEEQVKDVIASYQIYCKETVRWMIIEKNIGTEQEENLKERIRDLEEEVKELNSQGKVLLEKIAMLMEQLRKSKEEDEYLKRQVDHFKTERRSMTHEFSAKRDYLKRQVEELESEVDRLTKRDSHTKECAAQAANMTSFPPAQAALGAVGGAFGLVKYIFSPKQ